MSMKNHHRHAMSFVHLSTGLGFLQPGDPITLALFLNTPPRLFTSPTKSNVLVLKDFFPTLAFLFFPTKFYFYADLS